MDSVYIDNAADAHILAFEKLAPGAACAGKPYFISNDEPMPVFDLVNKILAAASVPPVTRSIPLPVAMTAGFLLETVYRLFSIKEDATDDTFRGASARDFALVRHLRCPMRFGICAICHH